MSGQAKKSQESSRQRRKEERPTEILEVATNCFLQNGYEATKLDYVARQAGIAKGTIYIYFPTKEDLFRAVVQQATESSIQTLTSIASSFDGSVTELIPSLISHLVQNLPNSKGPALARLIFKEVDRFPDLARVWFEVVATPLLASFESVLQKAQEKGEIKDGDTRLLIFSILGPMTTGIMFSDLVSRIGHEPLDLHRLSKQHSEMILHGLLRNKKTLGDES